MIDLDKLRIAEVGFSRDFADLVECPWGWLFYNLDNPQSHDSNHAVVLNYSEDLEEAVDDIIRFYTERGLSPRVYSACLPLNEAHHEVRLKRILAARRFEFLQDVGRSFVWQGPSRIVPNPVVQVERAHALTPDLVALLNSEEEQPWNIGVLQRHLQVEAFHLLVGRVAGETVTMASLKFLDGLSRVDDVQTHPAHRGRGYARALIHELVRYHAARSGNTLYLYASNPTAIRLYEEAGFVEQTGLARFWAAYLP
jgi:GNAT superfamily N-acetyltransferase